MDFTSEEFARQFTYNGPLGCEWSTQKSTFRVWAPQALWVSVHLYNEWNSAEASASFEMVLGNQGVWEVEVPGNLSGKYYTYETFYEGRGAAEAVDPYATMVAPQGRKGYIFDLGATDPEGWANDISPPLSHVLDSVVYELHVRDLSSLDNSSIAHRGQFLGLAESGTQSPQGLSTGLDHMVELGATHVHLLPIFDFDEVSDLEYNPQNYNWGYNPRNFNALKGAYSSNPLDPAQAVRDFKFMVKTLHWKGLRVVMDVVYNHTYSTSDSNLNKIYPFYYYRMFGSHFSNGSGCGNELATERPMVRRMIVDSLKHWMRTYHLDGFRFDLMGLYDVETMNLIARELRKNDPNLLLYGEGWTGGLSTLGDDQKATKLNAAKTREIAYFSDDVRDAVKGHVFDVQKKGFVNGGENLEASIQFAAVGCVNHPQIRYDQLLYSREAWAVAPHQTVNYVAAHDNHTLWDKLAHTNPHDSESERVKMVKLAHGTVFLSQGIPFLHAGEEFLRTKRGVENSYNSSDGINGIDWSAKSRHLDVHEYVRGLIALRKMHPALRLRSTEQVRSHLRFLELLEPKMAAWVIEGWAGGDPCEKVLVILNAHPHKREVHLPQGDWTIYANHERAGCDPLGVPTNQMVVLPGRSLMVLATARGSSGAS